MPSWFYVNGQMNLLYTFFCDPLLTRSQLPGSRSQTSRLRFPSTEGIFSFSCTVNKIISMNKQILYSLTFFCCFSCFRGDLLLELLQYPLVLHLHPHFLSPALGDQLANGLLLSLIATFQADALTCQKLFTL